MKKEEWAYMTSQQLEDSLSGAHRALFDVLILKNDCEKANEKKYLPEIKQTIQTYKKLIKNYEDGITTLRNREAFLA